jgi:streptogramin lyase
VILQYTGARASGLRFCSPLRAFADVSDSEGGIAAGPDGNLWFTEPNVNKIGRIKSYLNQLKA